MTWEDLKVYRPLTKEELKPAFKDFTKIIAENLGHFGFKLKGRKIQRIANDVLQTIHIDTRGSWTGISDNYKIEVSVAPLCNNFFINGELSGTKRIEDLIPKIRNHSRITQEYKLLADFMTRQIIDKVLDYFDLFNSTQKIIQNPEQFPTGDMGQRNEGVIIFSALKNHDSKSAEKKIDKILNHWGKFSETTNGYFSDYLNDLRFFAKKIKEKDWNSIDRKLTEDEEKVLKKLKLNQSGER
jgi:hypothetical protein